MAQYLRPLNPLAPSASVQLKLRKFLGARGALAKADSDEFDVIDGAVETVEIETAGIFYPRHESLCDLAPAGRSSELDGAGRISRPAKNQI